MPERVLAQISHIVFDLDGLLIDSETCYERAYGNVTRMYGKEFTWHLKTKCMGLNDIQVANLIIETLGLSTTAYQLDAEIYEQFLTVVKDIELMPGAERLVKHLFDCGIPMAIASGSDRKHFDVKTAKYFEFFDKYFDFHVLSPEDPKVKRGKPYPDVLIETMRKYGTDLKPQNFLVFEDSDLGIEAALAAKMPCVWVPDSRCDKSYSKATQVLNSLNEFEPQLFGLPPFHLKGLGY